MAHPLLSGFERYLPNGGLNAARRIASPKSKFGPPSPAAMRYARDSFGNNGFNFNGNGLGLFARDAAVAGGLIFLESELEKIDPKIREPLTSITYPRDIIIKSGGGWVDHTSTFVVDYGITAPNALGFMGTQTTQIPIMQGNLNKDIFPVSNWGNVMKINWIDMQKSQGAGRSLADIYDKGIKLNWNKSLDLTTYQGWGTNPGLVNDAAVARSTVPNGASGFSNWARKTQLEILSDINLALVTTWSASQFDISGMADTLLIPPTQFGIITQPVTTAGSVSTLNYVLDNSIAKSQGVDLKIFPSRWCSGAGTGATDRMVAYVNNEDRTYLDVTVPVQRIMTQPTVTEGGAYLTLYLGQIGVVKKLFFQPFAYFDGI
jgi:hypothetical protein